MRTAGNEGIAGEKRINRNNIEKLIEKNFKVNKIDEVSHKYKIVWRLYRKNVYKKLCFIISKNFDYR